MIFDRKSLFIGITAQALLFPLCASATDQRYLTYEGRIVNAAGAPVTGNVQFHIQVTDTLGTCVIWDESQPSVNLTSGAFAVQIGSGTVNFNGTSSSYVDGIFGASTLNCKGGTPSATITPALTDDRNVTISFNDGSGWQSLPQQVAIKSVPFSMYAESANGLYGYPISTAPLNNQVLQFSSATGQWVPTTLGAAGGGLVTSVTASAPLSSSGGVTPNITLGTVPVGSGGTNWTGPLANNRMMVSSAGSIIEGPALTNGQIFIGSSGAAPVAASLTAGSGITITPAAGSITIASNGSASATSLSGIVPVANGGTNLSTVPTNGQLLIGNGTGYALGTLTGTAHEISVTNGAGSITLSTPQGIDTSSSPTFAGLTDSGLTVAGFVTNTAGGVLGTTSSVALGSQVSGTLPVTNGGTGQNLAYTANNLVIANGTGSALISGPALASTNAANAVIQRDASGNFAANSGTFASDIQIGSTATACAAGIAGAIQYTGGGLQFCNGANWTTLTTGGGGTVGTATQYGVAYYNTTTSTASSAVASASNQVLTGQTNGAPVFSTATLSNTALNFAGNGSVSAAAGSTTTIGSSAGASATVIQAGTGNIDLNGNVGVGTASPVTHLDVIGASGGASPGTGLAFFNANTGSGNESKIYIQSSANNHGQLQIGNPSGAEVSLAYIPNVTAFGNAPTTSSGTTFNQGVGGYSLGPSVYFIGPDSMGATAFQLKSNGDVSITQSESDADGGYRFDVQKSGTNGTARFYDQTAGTGATNVLIQGGAAAGDATTNQLFRINQGGGTTGLMVVQGNGNIGIGTTSPASALDVNGALSMEGMAAPAVAGLGQGRIYFDSTSNQFMASQNNAGYVALVTSGGSSSFSAETINDGSAAGPSINFASDTTTGIYDVSGTHTLGLASNGVSIATVSGPLATGGMNIAATTASTSSTTGALTTAGGLGVAGAANIGTSLTTPIIYGSNAASGTLTLDGTSNATPGYVLMNPSGGNVGIGTTGPSQPLQVGPTSPSGSNPYTLLNGLRISGGDTENTIWQPSGTMGINTNGANLYLGYGNGVEAITILGTNGNVGIGTTSPTSNLGIYKDFGGGAGAGASLLLVNGNNPGDSNFNLINLQKTASTVFKVTGAGTVGAAGSVGVGTTSPSYLLDVFKDFGGGVGGGSTISRIYGNNPADSNYNLLDLSNNGSMVMRVQANGYVGIGTTNPGAKLEVDGSSGTTLKIVDGNQSAGRVLTSDANGVASWASPSASIPIQGGTSPGFNANYYYLTQESGTTTLPWLLMSGSTYNTGGVVGIGGLYDGGSSPYLPAIGIAFMTDARGTFQSTANNGTIRMYINQAGNVGIGTTVPQSLLDVNGGVSVGSYAGNNAAPSNGMIVSGKVGIGTTNPATALQVAGTVTASGATVTGNTTTTQVTETAVSLGTSMSGTVTLNLASGTYFYGTLTGNTTFAVSNAAAAGLVSSFTLELTNAGAYTNTWMSGTKWPGGTAPTLTAAGTDLLVCSTRDGATTWRCVASELNSQ